jgi:hypothetical protein
LRQVFKRVGRNLEGDGAADNHAFASTSQPGSCGCEFARRNRQTGSQGRIHVSTL